MIGFIGAGNMAEAIVKGLISSDFESAENICISDKNQARLNVLSDFFGVNKAQSNAEAVKKSDVVVLAVKPNVLETVLSEIAPYVSDKLIISIAAGKTLEFYENFLSSASVIRVMPNINAVVGEAVSAFCTKHASREQMEFAKSFLSSFGGAIEIDESLFSIFSAIGGCSPAFAYIFIDSMARAGVKHGLSKADALKISAQAVLGSAKMILESSAHPWELTDRVCSPGGTTIEGVVSLQNDAFESSVIKAVEASFNKDSKV